MPIVEQRPRRATQKAGASLVGRSAFGVKLVEADGSTPRVRTIRWLHTSTRELASLWKESDARRMLERRHPDGRLFLRVDHDERVGYLVHAPHFGRHLIAPDGGTITSALPTLPPSRWERLFLARVLPLAAVLHGLEVFHASAVALGDDVLAFSGAAGVGKTSTAAHLLGLGAEFVTDDVLAVETCRDRVVAY